MNRGLRNNQLFIDLEDKQYSKLSLNQSCQIKGHRNILQKEHSSICSNEISGTLDSSKLSKASSAQQSPYLRINQQQYELKSRGLNLQDSTEPIEDIEESIYEQSPKRKQQSQLKQKLSSQLSWFKDKSQSDDLPDSLSQISTVRKSKYLDDREPYVHIHRDTSLTTVVDVQEHQQVIKSQYVYVNGYYVTRPGSTLHKKTNAFAQYTRKDADFRHDHPNFNYGLKPKYRRLYSSKIEKHREMLIKDKKSQMTQIDANKQREHYLKFFEESFRKKKNQDKFDESSKNAIINKHMTRFELIRAQHQFSQQNSPRIYKFDPERKQRYLGKGEGFLNRFEKKLQQNECNELLENRLNKMKMLKTQNYSVIYSHSQERKSIKSRYQSEVVEEIEDENLIQTSSEQQISQPRSIQNSPINSKYRDKFRNMTPQRYQTLSFKESQPIISDIIEKFKVNPFFQSKYQS